QGLALVRQRWPAGGGGAGGAVPVAGPPRCPRRRTRLAARLPRRGPAAAGQQHARPYALAGDRAVGPGRGRPVPVWTVAGPVTAALVKWTSGGGILPRSPSPPPSPNRSTLTIFRARRDARQSLLTANCGLS